MPAATQESPMTMIKASMLAALGTLGLALTGCPDKKSEAESPDTSATAEPAAEAKPAEEAEPADDEAQPAEEAKPAEEKDQGGGW
jgi:hypothetical protein